MNKREKKDISIGIALLPIIFTTLCLFTFIIDLSNVDWIPKIGDTPIIGWGIGSPHMPLLLGIVFSCIVAWYLGFTWNEIEKIIVESIKTVLPAIIILLLIGMIIASWIASGIVATMIYYGLYVLKPAIFLFATLIITAVVSLAIGSSFSTAATIGIALAGIAQVYYTSDFMLAATVGAIISGSFFGDKMSPLSDTTNFAPAVSGTDLHSHIKQMLITTVPAFIITAVLFLVVGLFNIPSTSSSDISSMQDGIKILFNVNPLILVVPLVTILAAVFKLPTVPTLFGGAMLGLVVAVALQSESVPNVFNMLHYGFEFSEEKMALFQSSSLVTEDIKVTIINLFDGRGGLDSMLWTASLIMIAISFGGILNKTGMLGVLLESVLNKVEKHSSIAITTIVTGIVVNFVTGEQYMSIALPGSIYKEKYFESGLHPAYLSSNLEVGGTITAVLVPWGTCGAFMTGLFAEGSGSILSSGLDYIPFLWFNYINIAIAIIFAIFGIGVPLLSDKQKELHKEDPSLIIILEN